MDLGPHVSFPQMRAKGAPFATPMRNMDPARLRGSTTALWSALTRKGSKQELLDFLEFVAGVNRVTSLCGDMRHLPTLIDMLN